MIIAAKIQDKKFWNLLSGILGSYFPTVHVYDRKLTAMCHYAEFVITDTQSFDVIEAGATLVIYKDAQEIPPNFFEGQQAVAIVDSCNKDLYGFVNATKLPAITCGLSAKDTITLSSIGQDSAVIDLQRSVTCFDGTVVEPQEIPLQLSTAVDSFALMAAAAVFILTGNIERLCSLEI